RSWVTARNKAHTQETQTNQNKIVSKSIIHLDDDAALRRVRAIQQRAAHPGKDIVANARPKGASQFLAMPVARASRPFALNQKLTGGTPVPPAADAPRTESLHNICNKPGNTCPAAPCNA